MKTLSLVLVLLLLTVTAQAGSLVITTQEPDGRTKTVIDEKFPPTPSSGAAGREIPAEKDQGVSSSPAHQLSAKDTRILTLEIEKARLDEEIQALNKKYNEAIGNPFAQDTLKKEIMGVQVRKEALEKDPDGYFEKYFKGKKSKSRKK
ncbi:MAG: hypothetical protein KKB20_17710 [Proteobacteria bacterium]|nr:hypothetical protein [Pseudomonadota bacterium]